MKHLKGILATSHVDLHDEIMPLQTLETMAKQINTHYIPMGIEHDPRIPPQGRLITAQVVKLEDGEYGVEGLGEIFEPGDSYELKDAGREIPIHKNRSKNKIEIGFDRNYRSQEDQEIIKEISKLFGSEPQEELKKALDPISIITISCAFLLGGLANGFLGKMGSDAFDAFKGKLKKLLKKKEEEKDHERLLDFRFLIEINGCTGEVETILTNPTDDDIDEFFEDGLKQLDSVVLEYFDPNIGLRKITLEYSNRRINLLFGIRKDAVPMFPKDRETKFLRRQEKKTVSLNLINFRKTRLD